MRFLLLFSVSIASAFPCAGCGDSSGPEEGAACGDGTELSFSPGLTPVFTWVPDCAALTLYVLTSEGPQGPGANNAVWAIQVPPGSGGALVNRIRTGVMYGETPPTATELIVPIPLKSGVQYSAFLEVSLGGGNGRVVASNTFTPN